MDFEQKVREKIMLGFGHPQARFKCKFGLRESLPGLD